MFTELVNQAIDAGIPLERVDCTLYADISRLQLKFQREKDGNTAARIMRTITPLFQAAGLTSVGRKRLGVVRQKRKLTGPLAVLQSREEPTAE